ncbi:hypothetical protein ACERIN_25005, partial [Klebsiella pneumoniae]
MEKYIYFMCNKDVTLVLTDDYYFYFGLKQLTGLPLVYITYEGSMDKPIVIKQKRNIRVLVDSRIFYSGKWDGYKMLRKTLNMISQWMWLDISGGGGGGPPIRLSTIFAPWRVKKSPSPRHATQNAAASSPGRESPRLGSFSRSLLVGLGVGKGGLERIGCQ